MYPCRARHGANEGPLLLLDDPGPDEQNWLRMLLGGDPEKANLPSLVNHWLMIHEVLVPGRSKLVVTRGVR